MMITNEEYENYTYTRIIYNNLYTYTYIHIYALLTELFKFYKYTKKFIKNRQMLKLQIQFTSCVENNLKKFEFYTI